MGVSNSKNILDLLNQLPKNIEIADILAKLKKVDVTDLKSEILTVRTKEDLATVLQKFLITHPEDAASIFSLLNSFKQADKIQMTD